MGLMYVSSFEVGLLDSYGGGVLRGVAGLGVPQAVASAWPASLVVDLGGGSPCCSGRRRREEFLSASSGAKVLGGSRWSSVGGITVRRRRSREGLGGRSSLACI